MPTLLTGDLADRLNQLRRLGDETLSVWEHEETKAILAGDPDDTAGWRRLGTAAEYRHDAICPDLTPRLSTVSHDSSCLFCRQPLAAGEQAMLGAMGPYNYIMYAHIACYEAEQRRVATAQAEARAAAQGPQITVWYGPDAHVVAAPRTGHADAEARALPAELPDLPVGAVAYDELRRPFAKARIAFPVVSDADAWWRAATSDPGVSYELFWFESQAEQASREWRGRGFSAVESRAKIAELMAEPEEY
ncbi:MAG TPA: hypothetical protein VFN76_04250 [Candidatus Limnocylindria bacterium]|nr:hypothetical protein [Candidatus Limnocylindria bacterium]